MLEEKRLFFNSLVANHKLKVFLQYFYSDVKCLRLSFCNILVAISRRLDCGLTRGALLTAHACQSSPGAWKSSTLGSCLAQTSHTSIWLKRRTRQSRECLVPPLF